MIQVKTFHATGILRIHKALDNLNEFLKTIQDEDIIKIDKIASGGYMLIYKSKETKL